MSDTVTNRKRLARKLRNIYRELHGDPGTSTRVLVSNWNTSELEGLIENGRQALYWKQTREFQANEIHDELNK